MSAMGIFDPIKTGIFDDTAFDTEVYNRGWIIVDYID